MRGDPTTLFKPHTEECEWKPVRFSGAAPSACSGHTGVTIDDTMVVFGGYDPSGFRDTVFTLALP